MKTNYLIVAIFFISTLLSGCDKDNSNKNIEDGIYKGKFTVTYGSEKQTEKTILTLKSGKFSCSENSNRIPAGGSGTFSSHNNTITFNDENIWTADFDWNLILNGQYYYTFDGIPIDTPYIAKIEIKYPNGWLPKEKNSTMFPSNWSSQRIHEEVAWVYENMMAKGKGLNPKRTGKFKKYIGKSSDGSFNILIEIKNGNIMNAYPYLKKNKIT